MTRLWVNLDPVAVYRRMRQTDRPDPVAAAVQAELGGADGIALHLHDDRNQPQELDIERLKRTVQTRLMLRLPPAADVIGVALDVKPDMVTLVPAEGEGRPQTGGLDLMTRRGEIAETVEPLKNGGLPVCLAIGPSPDHVKLAHRLDVDAVEIDTRSFAETASVQTRPRIRDQITDAVKLAHRLRMTVFAGRGLDYLHVQELAGIREIDAFCIGHSIVARALLVGLSEAVRDMRRRIRDGA